MEIRILAFGIAREIVGADELVLSMDTNATVANLKSELVTSYPKLAALKSLAIAINESYALDDLQIHEKDVVALIPPVSGG